MPGSKGRRAAGGDRPAGSLLLAFGVGFSYQLGLEDPPQSREKEDGERGVGGDGQRERVLPGSREKCVEKGKAFCSGEREDSVVFRSLPLRAFPR